MVSVVKSLLIHLRRMGLAIKIIDKENKALPLGCFVV